MQKDRFIPTWKKTGIPIRPADRKDPVVIEDMEVLKRLKNSPVRRVFQVPVGNLQGCPQERHWSQSM